MRLKLEMKNNFVTNCRDHPVSGRMARAFNRYGATQAVAFHISTAFDMVWLAGLLHKLKSYGILGLIFGLISSFVSNRWLQVVLDAKSSQECSVNAGVPQGFILGPTLFLLHIKVLCYFQSENIWVILLQN